MVEPARLSRRLLLALLISAAVLAAAGWSLDLFLDWSRPLSTVQPGDARLNLYILAWNHHILGSSPGDYFQANILHPHRDSLATSEHLFLPSLLTWPLAAGMSNPVAGYLGLIALGFLGAFWGAYGLLRTYRLSSPAALLGAFTLALSTTMVTEAVGHPQTLQLYGLLGALAFFHRWMDRARPGDAVGLGICLAVQALSAWYPTALMVPALLLAGALPFGRARRRFDRRRLLGLAAAVAGAILATAPLARPYLAGALGGGGDASPALAISPWAYLRPMPGSIPWRLLGLTADGISLEWRSAGWSVLILAGIGLAWPARADRRDRGLRWLALALVGLGLAASMGGAPQRLLEGALPFLRVFRALYRYALLVSLGLALLAARAVDRGARRMPPIRQWGLAVLLCLLFLGETHMFLRVDPPGFRPNRVDRWLAEAPGDPVVAYIPDGVDGLIPWTTDAMAHSVFHWRRMVNGYGRFWPPGYRAAMTEINRFPAPESLSRLRQMGVDLVVVVPGYHLEEDLAELTRGLAREDLAGELRLLDRFFREVLDDPTYRPPAWEQRRRSLEAASGPVCLARFPEGWIFALGKEAVDHCSQGGDLVQSR